MQKLFISDDRMLKLMDHSIVTGLARNETQYLTKIGFTRSSLRNVRVGLQGFTKEHILAAAELTGVNINWIFGLEQNMMRKESSSPFTRLKEAIADLELQLNTPITKGSNKTKTILKKGQKSVKMLESLKRKEPERRHS